MKHFLVKTVFVVAFNILLSSPTRTAIVYVSSSSTNSEGKGTSCGSSAHPCRTIQAAINNAKQNSEIKIMASETPYNDCPIVVDKPLKFTGTGGTPVVDCEGKQDAFRIEVKQSKKIINLVVMMSAFKIRNAKTAIFYGGMPDVTIVQISKLIFEGNAIDVHMKNVHLCSLTMKDVIARGSHGDGIRFESCGNTDVHLTNCEFHGKYLDVVSTRLGLTLAMFNVKFDMKTRRPNAAETRSPVHIETSVQNITSITVSKRSQFLNHAGKRHGSVTIESPLQILHNKSKTKVSGYVQFTDVTFANNSVSAGNGSAFSYVYKGPKFKYARVIFRKCSFRQNSAFIKGGALWLEKIQFVVLDNCVFSRNRAHATGKGQGGAVFSAGNGRLDVKNCSFHSNSASRRGGALHVLRGGSTTVIGGIFGNDRDSRGGTLGDVMYVNENNVWLKGKVVFDLQSAHSGQSMIWFRSEAAILRMSNSTQFTCPKGYHYELMLDTTPIRHGVYHFFAFKCAPCHDQFYSVSRGYHAVNGADAPGKCRSCPNGASCDGTIRARENFWGAVRGDEVEMIPCPRGYCCDREPCDGYDSCASHRTGTLCGRCEDGFSEGVSSAVCHANDYCRSWYLVFLLLCTLVLFTLLLFQQEFITRLTKCLQCNENDTTYRSEPTTLIEEDEDNSTERAPLRLSVDSAPDCARVPESEEYNNTGGYIKSFIYFYQVVELLGISSNASRDAFPNGVIEFLMPFLNLQFGDVFTKDCLFENVTPEVKTLFKNSVCFFLFSYCFLSYLGYRLARRCLFRGSVSVPDNTPGFEARSYPVRLTGAVMHIILLSYVALTQLTFRLLHCVQIGDHHVLQIDGHVVCYKFFQGIIWLLFSVYIISFPFMLIFGRHLLHTGRLSARRFIVACIFPTVFLLYWIYQYKFRGEYRGRSVAQPGRNHHRDKILYILQYPYKESPENPTWLERMAENWESVLMFRRLALVAVFIFADSFLLRSYLHFLFSFIFLLHHFFAQPFVNARVNSVETISLSVLMLFSGFGIAEASFSAAGEAVPPLIATTTAIRDYLIALIPFVILVIILFPRIKYHCSRWRKPKSPSFQPLS